MRAAVLVMAKAPRPGMVKTRLEPSLGPRGCARLQMALIRRAADLASAIAPQAAFVAHSPAGSREEVLPLVPDGVTLFDQPHEDLGRGITSAVERVFRARGGAVVVLGTDVPTLEARHVSAALDALAGGDDICFGPAADGGYYLVALARPCAAVFALEGWGGPRVLEQSLDAAEAAGFRAGTLWEERDLDDADDARALLANPALPSDVAALLAPAAR